MNYILEHSGREGLTRRFWNSGVSGWVHRQIATVYTEAEKDRSLLAGIWVAVNAEQATGEQPDRQAASLGTLDAHGLAALRQVLLTVIDDGDRKQADYDTCGKSNCGALRWYHDDGRTATTKTHGFVEPSRGRDWQFAGETEAATEARMRFVEAAQAEIVRRAMPATAGRAK